MYYLCASSHTKRRYNHTELWTALFGNQAGIDGHCIDHIQFLCLEQVESLKHL